MVHLDSLLVEWLYSPSVRSNNRRCHVAHEVDPSSDCSSGRTGAGALDFDSNFELHRILDQEQGKVLEPDRNFGKGQDIHDQNWVQMSAQMEELETAYDLSFYY